jgi:hypothetical protein
LIRDPGRQAMPSLALDPGLRRDDAIQQFFNWME